MIVKFYEFTKRLNSTKLPDVDSVDIDVRLLEPSSIDNPIIIIKEGRSLAYNYCYIPTFARYYWVTNKTVLDNNRVRYALQIDVLATYKNQIASYRTLIKRRPSVNNAVVDGMWTPKLKPTVITTKTADLGLDASGTYLLFVSNDEGGNYNGINPTQTVYAMNEFTVRRVCSALFNSNNYGSKDSPTELVMDITQQTICNPLQFVTKCMWFPFYVGGDGVSKVSAGWVDLELDMAEGTNISIVRSPSARFTTTVSKLHSSSYAYYFSDAMAQYYIYVPGCGVQSIPANLSDKTLTVNVDVDLITGSASAEILTGSTIIASMQGVLGFSIPISGVNYEIPSPTTALVKMGSSLINNVAQLPAKLKETVANAFGGDISPYSIASAYVNMLVPGAGSAVTGIADWLGVDMGQTATDIFTPTIPFSDIAQVTMQPTPSTIGGYSNTSLVKHFLTVRTGGFVNDPIIRDLGSICGNATHEIGTVTASGYYQFTTGDVPCTATASERSQISAFLTGGFWYE